MERWAIRSNVANLFSLRRNTRGFTIVELLIVIVVIAILAAITVVAYTGISNRANDTAIRGDLASLSRLMGVYKVTNERYPQANNSSLGGATLPSFKANKTTYDTSSSAGTSNLTFCVTTGGTNFAVLALSKSGNAFYVADGSGAAAFTGTWGTTSGDRCTSLGTQLSLTYSANYNGFSASDVSTGPWRSWAGGN